ncbi:MAG: tetratricopeptide repeat protein [Rhodospirillaceae bacterium]|nr:tetratricopeptide repeat protein [Rhodospirillaceae bacterium]
MSDAVRLGLDHMKARRFSDAGRMFEQILAQRPDDPDALHLLGMALHEQGRSEEAVESIRKAIARHDSAPDFHASLGTVLLKLGRSGEAATSLRRAVELGGGQQGAYRNLGTALIRIGEITEAGKALGRAVESDPEDPEAYFALGFVHARQRAMDQAIKCYRKTLELAPNHIGALNNIATLLQTKDEATEAIGYLQKLVQLQPKSAMAFYNLGRGLEALGELDLALKAYDHAVVLKPDFAQAHNNGGTLLQRQRRMPEAVERFERSIAADPGYANARFNRAVSLLTQGRFREGWEGYDARFQVPELRRLVSPRPFRQPRWEGQPLAGETILVWGEQGIGDEILHASMIPDLQAMGAKVVVECDPRLVGLFRRSFPGAQVSGRADPPEAPTNDPAIAYQCPMGSLGRWLRDDLARFPAHRGYLQADPGRVEGARARYAELGPGLKIGIAWRTGSHDPRGRNVTLQQLEPVLQRQNAHFVTLQYGDVGNELHELAERSLVRVYRDPTIDPTRDLEGIAAQVAALDMVISTTNAIAHFAGALGTPSLIFVPFAPDWCWLQSGARMPWYPTMRLVRQTAPEEWATTISGVADALDGL